ncbi:IS4 family transposase [Comamonas sp. NyZ500]|uniref:IS4 family transposase n=1 Tax=Comamonas sp. NyZ500 TaxID=2795732 RepID=UPI00192B027B|nr:IS4 family transposase [Comamonas sp. NyZ500]MBL5980612.1 IS4 family transposase [Comamonas sp. NyZ500]
MLEFSARVGSEEFAQLARHPDCPRAFMRRRKLPLPELIGALLSMRNQSQQAMLDGFFATVGGSPTPRREVSDRAFAKARDHLHLPALESLNALVVRRCDEAGLISRWHGLRVVAGDASVLMPAVRPCLLQRSAAGRDQRLFALFLPGADLTLHASVHSGLVAERAMLVEALDALGPDDVLVLDRGYPAAWLVAMLTERGIRFVMRCDNNSGWAATKKFMRSGALDATVTLNAPSADEVRTWGCPARQPALRLVRQVAPNGQVRVLATNLEALDFPATLFAELYHQRWRIEEAFKRLKHRLHLEAVSGLSQQALIIDVAAKVLADNLTSLMCQAAAVQADLTALSRKCNRSYAAGLMQHLLPRLVLWIGDVAAEIAQTITLLGRTTQRFVQGRSQPRPARHLKPHPSCAYKR